MKKFISTTILSLITTICFGMSYNEARQQALFLTDKMAYELNLNEQQFNDCFEINLDYLMGVVTADDVYGPALEYRNADLRHILYDWQWDLFMVADYFLRPLRWLSGAWMFPIYSRYEAARFFFGRPAIYSVYRGGHGRYYYSNGFYVSRRPTYWHGGMRGRDFGPAPHHDHRGYHIGGPVEHRGHIEHRPGGHSSYPQHTGRSGGGPGYHIGTTSHTDHGNRGDYSGNRDRGSYSGSSTHGSGRSTYSGSSTHSSDRGSYGGSSTHSSDRGSYGGSSTHGSDRGSYSGSHSGMRSDYSGGRSSNSSYSHPSSTRSMSGSHSSHSGSSHSSHSGGGRSGNSRGGR